MANDLALYRCGEITRSLQVLKETIERRVPPDDAVDARLYDLVIEVKLLERELKKEK